MSAEKLPYMPRYCRDFIADTRHLSLEQKGAYSDLLDHQWLLGALPADEEKLQRMVGATDREWKRVWPEIEKYFPAAEDGQLRNGKLERVREFHLGKRRAGSTGGSTRASNTRSRTASRKPSNGVADPQPQRTEDRGQRTENRSPTPGGGGIALPPDLTDWLEPGYHEDLARALRASHAPEAVIANLREIRKEPEQFGIRGPVTGLELGIAIRSGAEHGYHPTVSSLKVGIEKARRNGVMSAPVERGRGLDWEEGT